MEKYDYVIIGGGVAGTTAAVKIRERDERASIAIMGNEPCPLYNRTLLAHYITGKLKRESLFMRNSGFYSENGIELIFENVISLDAEKSVVHCESGREARFNSLLIASGGSPRPWKVRGSNLNGVHRFHTLADADAIKARLRKVAAYAAPRAVIVGGGFIGLDLLSICAGYNIPVTLIILEPYIFAAYYGEKGGEIIKKAVARHGCEVLCADEVVEICGKGEVDGVRTKLGKHIPCCFVGVGIGILGNISYLEHAGISIGQGILTDERLRTNVPQIYAAGDVAEFYDVIFKKRHLLGNWVNAVKQGEAAGENMAGGNKIYESVSGYAASLFGLTLSLVGDVSSSDSEYIENVDMGKESYARYFLRDSRLVGASLINRSQETSVLRRLIEEETDMSRYKDNMSSPDFDPRVIIKRG